MPSKTYRLLLRLLLTMVAIIRIEQAEGIEHSPISLGSLAGWHWRRPARGNGFVASEVQLDLRARPPLRLKRLTGQ